MTLMQVCIVICYSCIGHINDYIQNFYPYIKVGDHARFIDLACILNQCYRFVEFIVPFGKRSLMQIKIQPCAFPLSYGNACFISTKYYCRTAIFIVDVKLT